MKKTLALMLAVLFAFSTVFSAFSADLLEVNYYFEDGNTVYVFGELSENEEFDEIGIYAGGKNYPLDDVKNYQAKTNGKFGIGLKDPATLLGVEFDVSSYKLLGEESTAGETKHISRNPHNAVSEITVGGKTVSNYYQGTEETDFYYGLDELPEDASELPPVIVKAGETSYDISVSAEVGGYVAAASYKGTGAVKVHFRKFAEVTKEVPLENMYRVHSSYVHFADEYDKTPPYAPASPNNTVKSKENIYADNESQLIYAHYEIPDVEGYAPVGYTYQAVTGSINPGNTVSVYNYRGNLEDFVTPERKNETSFWVPLKTPVHFAGFNGLSETDAYKVATLEVTSSRKKHTVESTYINEKNAVIIYKNDNTDVERQAILYIIQQITPTQ